MSQEARDALAKDPRLHANDLQKSDLRDQYKTSTWLIEFLQKLLDECEHPILITALYSDHHPGTLHHPYDGRPGRAMDGWIANWETVGDEKVLAMMQAGAKIGNTKEPFLVEVGLSGTAAELQSQVEWGDITNVFVEQTAEHVHFAVGEPT